MCQWVQSRAALPSLPQTKEAEAAKEAEELAQLEADSRPRGRPARSANNGGSTAWNRLTRTRTDKTQVSACSTPLCLVSSASLSTTRARSPMA